MRKFKNQSNISGYVISKIRKENNVTKEKLCSQLQLMGINIDRVHLYKIEKGTVILKDFELLAICKILKIDFNNLIPLLDD